MRFQSSIAALLTTILFTSTALALEQEVVSFFQRHKAWQSLVLSGPPIQTGIFSTRMPGQSKKWLLANDGLIERTKLTVAIDCSQLDPKAPDIKKAFRWSSGRIDFQSPLDDQMLTFNVLQSFQRCQKPSNPPKFSFKILDNDRLEIQFDDARESVFFFPEVESKPFRHAIPGQLNNVVTAPLGNQKDSLRALGLEDILSTVYLHHDLSERKTVFIDTSFPPQYIPVLASAIAEWNRAFGVQFFRLDRRQRALGDVECYTHSQFCVRWTGPPVLAWTRLTCIAGPSFDPESGKIIGGDLSCFNDANPAKETPRDVLTAYQRGPLSLDMVATMYLQREEYGNFKHPEPQRLLKYFFLHELGHLNGLSHNLLGSTRGVPAHPTATVMEYPPFPVMSQVNHLQRWDLSLLNSVYKGMPLLADYNYCGDRESEDLLARLQKSRKQPTCNKFDLGAPELWLIALARNGSDGLQSKDPYFDETIAKSMQRFLDPTLDASQAQRAKIKSYVCSVLNTTDRNDTIYKDLRSQLQCGL